MPDPVAGGTALATATAIGGVLSAGIAPAWTVSDVTMATIDPVGTAVTPGTTFTSPITYPTPLLDGTVTFTISATLPDGTVITGADSITITGGVVVPPTEPTGFGVVIS